ncbi:MAG: TraR/DksA C4-type zinc finger protein [Bacteriovoracaceae bacterium]|nr:TraR/DksA C4-type zinc finger protein [Bacteriovoracaceae bacterium]
MSKINIPMPDKRDNKHLKKRQIKTLWDGLINWKNDLETSLMECDTQHYCLDTNELADPIDEASVNSEAQKMLKLRNRDIFLLRKINKSMERIKEGTYGLCGECGMEIAFERLLARPVADFCISCKEENEIQERQRKKISKSAGRTFANAR